MCQRAIQGSAVRALIASPLLWHELQAQLCVGLQLGRRPIDRGSNDEVISLLLHAQATRPGPPPESQPSSAASVDPQVQASHSCLARPCFSRSGIPATGCWSRMGCSCNHVSVMSAVVCWTACPPSSLCTCALSACEHAAWCKPDQLCLVCRGLPAGWMTPGLQAQAECEAADLKESYDVRWGAFAAQSSPASLGDIPFPVHQDDRHLLLDVLLWGAQVSCANAAHTLNPEP